MVRIRRFGVIRTANLAAIAFALFTLVIIVPFVVILFAAGPISFTDRTTGQSVDFAGSPLLLLFVPLVYAIVGWIVTALWCLVYNLAAALTGGVEMQLEGDTPAYRTDLPPAG
ncbi:MAG TPA: hypothetical protein VF367_10980 [Candidatus Limnocylindria bacterium]|jgi:hypothetical protein